MGDLLGQAVTMEVVQEQATLDPHQQTLSVSHLRDDDCHDISSVISMATVSIPDTQQESRLLTDPADVHCPLDMSVEVFDAATEIEINTDDTEDLIMPDVHNPGALQCAFDIKDEVPDMVAAETVVTTTQPRRRKQRLDSHQARVVADDICVTDNADGAALWGVTIQNDALYLENPCTSSDLRAGQVVEVLTSGDMSNFVTLTSDGACKAVPVTTVTSEHSAREASIREISKRERDRIKKRRMRADPQYRLLEKDKSRNRMRLKRTEPGYREKEREKDRMRRRLARQQNDERRQRERERDKQYKKSLRCPLPTSVTNVETTSYSLDLVDINSVDL